VSNAAPTADSSRRYDCRPPRPDRPSDCCCLILKNPPELPDVATYSQEEQLSVGLAPTWNSPDITTNTFPPMKLLAEATVLVRNLSPKVTAVDAAVRASTSPFGIGTVRTALSTQLMTLLPGGATLLRYPFTQAILQGEQSIGFHIDIDLSVDERMINNRGSQTAHAFATSVDGRSYSVQFAVRNPLTAPQQITLAALANDLGAVVSPSAHSFAASEQIMANLVFRVPAALHGPPDGSVSREVTVVGRGGDGKLIDGVTYLVRIDD